jgi:cell division septation protein DedD
MTVRHLTNASAVVLAIAMLAACGGGGSTSSTVPSGTTPVNAPLTTQSLGVTFSGTQTLAKVRSPRDLTSTPITVSLNGTVIGTGTLDAKGHAKITFTAAVPAGSTVTITAGHLTVTATLAMTMANTAVLITINANGTVTVVSAADKHDDGQVDADDPEQQHEDEDGKGNPTSIVSNDSNVLPANAPFTLVNACGTLTLTPTNSAVAFIKFEEKGSDGESDDAGRVRFEGAFTGPLHFAVVNSAARVHIEIFDAQHNRLIEVKAPISAFTSGTTTNGSPCPSPTVTVTPSPGASASPRASETPEPNESESPRPTSTPTTTPIPTPTPTPTR